MSHPRVPGLPQVASSAAIPEAFLFPNYLINLALATTVFPALGFIQTIYSRLMSKTDHGSWRTHLKTLADVAGIDSERDQSDMSNDPDSL